MDGRRTLVKAPTAILARLAITGKVGRILAPKLDLLRAAGVGPAVAVRRESAGEGLRAAEARRSLYRQIWAEAARTLGAECEELVDDFLVIRRGHVRTVVWYHTVMLDFGVSLQLALDKVACHRLLADAGIPMAGYVEVDAAEPLSRITLLPVAAEKAVVVKPARSTSGGEGVTCGVRTPDDFERARMWARRWDSRLLIEQQGEGSEFRLLILDGKVLDVLIREPPRVIGDGRSTVQALICQENRRRATSGARAGLAVLTVDLDCVLTLGRAGLSLRSVPKRGVAVTVKSAVNQSGAREVRSVPAGVLGSDLIRDATRAVECIGLRFAGVDLITPDPSRSLAEAGGVVIEVNGTPGLHYHYLVSNPGEAIPVAVPLLDVLLHSGPDAGSGQFG